MRRNRRPRRFGRTLHPPCAETVALRYPDDRAGNGRGGRGNRIGGDSPTNPLPGGPVGSEGPARLVSAVNEAVTEKVNRAGAQPSVNGRSFAGLASTGLANSWLAFVALLPTVAGAPLLRSTRTRLAPR